MSFETLCFLNEEVDVRNTARREVCYRRPQSTLTQRQKVVRHTNLGCAVVKCITMAIGPIIELKDLIGSSSQSLFHGEYRLLYLSQCC